MRSRAIAALALLAACGQQPIKSPQKAERAVQIANAGETAAPGTAPFIDNPATSPAALPAGAIMLQRVAVNDPGVIAPGPALHGVIPAGWTTRGGVIPAKGLCSEPYLFDWTATSAERRSTVSLFPTEGWSWSNFGLSSDCPAAEWAGVRDYLAARVAATTPGARVLDFRERPDFGEGAKPAAAAQEKMFNSVGVAQHRIRVEGGEILYAYQEDGVDMRGMMSAVAMIVEAESANPMAGNQFDPLGGQPMRYRIGSVLGTFSSTAPNGALDFEMTEAVRKSFTPEPKWLEKLFALKTAIGAINANAAAERSAIIVAGGAAATASNIAAYKAMAGQSVQNSRDSIANQRGSGEIYPGSDAQDRMQRESIEAVRGVETYRDPVEGTNVQLDATFDHAWRINNQDSYILTKDPNFNPGAYGLEATEMGRVE
jgi:hypothetical protein